SGSVAAAGGGIRGSVCAAPAQSHSPCPASRSSPGFPAAAPPILRPLLAAQPFLAAPCFPRYPSRMNSTHGFFSWIKAAADGLAVRPRPPPPAMIGTPPSARPLWHDPAAHARDFAERYSVPLSYAAEQRMMDLSVPPDRIGMPDKHHGIQWSAF